MYIAFIVGTERAKSLAHEQGYKSVCNFHHFLINFACKVDINQVFMSKYIGNLNGVPVICSRTIEEDEFYVITENLEIKNIKDVE